MPISQKEKGNKFERKMANRFGKWMFQDENMLWRDSSSGGRKKIYSGDIIPAKAHEFPWTIWPFFFEMKSGYGANIPTLMNQTLLRQWIVKLMGELTTDQYIPMLVAQFNGYTPILLTTLLLNYHCDICLMQIYQNQFFQYYIYNLYGVMKCNFYEVIPAELTEYLQNSSSQTTPINPIVEVDTPSINPIAQKIRKTKALSKKEQEYHDIGSTLGEWM